MGASSRSACCLLGRDSVYLYQKAVGTYLEGWPPDLGWVAAGVDRMGRLAADRRREGVRDVGWQTLT